MSAAEAAEPILTLVHDKCGHVTYLAGNPFVCVRPDHPGQPENHVMVHR